jgi:glucuronoarabinoxylan endo-1,4-beta-xylanase
MEDATNTSLGPTRRLCVTRRRIIGRQNFRRFLACAFGTTLTGFVTNALAADAIVSVGTKKQVIDGFGASSAWSGAMSDKIFNGLYTDLGYSILRVRVEDSIGDNWKTGNFSSWAAELSNAKKAIARGAIVFASPWSPPKSMQQSFTHPTDKTNPFRLNTSIYADYLQYLNAYAKYFKDNGAELYAISVQNEPDYADGWCWWTADEILSFLKTYGGQINARVIAPESFQFRKNMSDPILNDATALANVDIIGYHIYGTAVSGFAYPLFQQKAAPLGKRLWQTEHYVGEDDNIGTLMSIAKEVHDVMVTGNANAYVYWWIPHLNGLTSTAGDLYKRAYVLGQFAKHIRPGYSRVEATATPSTNVYVSAYEGEGKVVIVAVNTGTASASQKFNLDGATVAQFSSWQTSSSANMVAGTTANVSTNSFTFSLPAQSITTFVGSNSAASGGTTGTGGATSAGGTSALGGSTQGAGGRTSAGGTSGLTTSSSLGAGGQAPGAGGASLTVRGGASGTLKSSGGATPGTTNGSGGGTLGKGSAQAIGAGGDDAIGGGIGTNTATSTLVGGGTAVSSSEPNGNGDAGCTCRVAERPSRPGSWSLGVLMGLAFLARRRNRAW